MSGWSVLILTWNEETNITDCIASCVGCDDIVVFDSLSTDRTCDMARAHGARVIQRRFDDYASQRNAALTEVPFKNPWVLMLDADERLTPALRAEIDSRVASAPADLAQLRFRRKDYFLGRWLAHASGYPTWFGRLVRIGRVHVHRAINEEYVADGRVEHLQEHVHHLPFNKGVSYWVERHNRYSSMESLEKLALAGRPVGWPALLGRDPVDRRRALKRLLYRTPGRPWLMFIALYVLRGGFLDGYAGFTYCRLRALYEYLIDLKALEQQRRRSGKPL